MGVEETLEEIRPSKTQLQLLRKIIKFQPEQDEFGVNYRFLMFEKGEMGKHPDYLKLLKEKRSFLEENRGRFRTIAEKMGSRISFFQDLQDDDRAIDRFETRAMLRDSGLPSATQNELHLGYFHLANLLAVHVLLKPLIKRKIVEVKVDDDMR
ncbi:MAG: hypothetical protein V1835_00540, partial [Candidatus Micrarchaeota archaeon]